MLYLIYYKDRELSDISGLCLAIRESELGSFSRKGRAHSGILHGSG